MSLLEAVIGVLAPPQCVVCGAEGSSLCRACLAAEIVPFGERCFDCGAAAVGGRTCPACRKSAPRYVWITTTYENAAQKLIKIYKFGHRRAVAESLATLMVETFFDFNTPEFVSTLNYLVVSVPTATSRIRHRSFDHSALVARHIARKLGLKYANALGRTGQTRQVGTKRAERLKQLEGQFFARLPYLIKGQNILLIDDVVTTGATLRATTKTLRAAGAKRIDALIFAKRL